MRNFINYNVLFSCGEAFVQSSECLFRARCLSVGIQNYPIAINQQRMLHLSFTSRGLLASWDVQYLVFFSLLTSIIYSWISSHNLHSGIFLHLRRIRVFRALRSLPQNEASASDNPSSPVARLSSTIEGSLCSFQGKQILPPSLVYIPY